MIVHFRLLKRREKNAGEEEEEEMKLFKKFITAHTNTQTPFLSTSLHLFP